MVDVTSFIGVLYASIKKGLLESIVVIKLCFINLIYYLTLSVLNKKYRYGTKYFNKFTLLKTSICSVVSS